MKSRIATHIIFWVVYMVSCAFISYINNPRVVFSDQFAKYLVSIAFFYWVLFTLFSNNNILLKTLYILGGICFYYCFRYVVYKYILTAFFNYPDIERIDFQFWISGIWWVVHYFVYAWFYWYYKTSIQSTLEVSALQKNNLELQSQNLQLQNEKLKAEYDFLKAQINPHFLYNTLSFFYAKTLGTDKQAAEGIALLTDIMRYSLQQGEADGKVGLNDEVTHLNNYIRLQQMRFNNSLNIQFTELKEPERYRILPHIFITLVENAFKHGEVNNPVHPLIISLVEKDSKLVFSVINKIRYGPVDSNSTGVGLNNIRNRIKIEYGDSARLENSITNDFFSVHFSVPLSQLAKEYISPAKGVNPFPFISKNIAL